MKVMMLDSVGGGFRGLAGATDPFTVMALADETLDAAYTRLKSAADAGHVDASLFAPLDEERNALVAESAAIYQEPTVTAEVADAFARQVAAFTARVKQATAGVTLKRWALIGGAAALLGGLGWFIVAYSRR